VGFTAPTNLSLAALFEDRFDDVVWAADCALAGVERMAGSIGSGVGDWLALIQGVAARGALAAVRLGQPVLAVSLLERGQGVLVSERLSGLRLNLEQAREDGHGRLVDRFMDKAAVVQNLAAVNTTNQRQGVIPEVGDGLASALENMAAAREALESALGMSLLPQGSIDEVMNLAAESGDSLVYLVMTEVSGAAVLVHPDGLIDSVEKP
jgi:hypothetical protein